MLDIAKRISASVSVFHDPQRDYAPRREPCTIADCVRTILNAGFGVETWLCQHHYAPLEEDAIQALSQLCRHAEIVSAHTSTLTWSPEGLRAEIGLAARIGADILVIHPNTLGLEKQAEPPTALELREICAFARDCGVMLAFENSGRTGIEMVRRAIDLVGAEPGATGMGICIDTGHAHRSCTWEGIPVSAFLEEFRDLIVEVHVDDNFGAKDLHLPPGEGTLDWAGVIPAIRSLPQDAVVCLEITTEGDPLQALAAAREFLCR